VDRCDLFGYLTAVEHIGALRCNTAQSSPEIIVDDPVAYLVQRAIWMKIDRTASSAEAQPRHIVGPTERCWSEQTQYRCAHFNRLGLRCCNHSIVHVCPHL
jgi:hypothetical protein